MIYIPLILFGLAAALGLVLLIYVLRGQQTPRILAILHGSCAFLGLLSLTFLAIYSPYRLWLSVSIFAVAALGGFYLLYKDLTGAIPKPIAVLHGMLALTAFIILIFSIISL